MMNIYKEITELRIKNEVLSRENEKLKKQLKATIRALQEYADGCCEEEVAQMALEVMENVR